MSTGARPISLSRLGDLSLASLFAGWVLADALQARLAADGFDDLRFADGVVFQHLVPGPLTIGALAERLGVSQQAASKSVADLERRGYVRRSYDPADARARLVELTDRGVGAIEGGRRHRAALAGELSSQLGSRRRAGCWSTSCASWAARARCAGGASGRRGNRVRCPGRYRRIRIAPRADG